MKRIAVVDYNAGNLFSVEQACKSVGLDPQITSDPAVLRSADALILPGVGSYGDAMENLNRLGLVQVLRDFAASGKPFMGVCLGMQLLFSSSEEFGIHRGLDIIPGTVRRFQPLPGSPKMKVPQIGWNRIRRPAGFEHAWAGTPLEGTADGAFMYFVHSYYVCPRDPGAVLCLSDYEGVQYCSAVALGSVFATQFHPEKSAEEGLKIYRCWAGRICTETRAV